MKLWKTAPLMLAATMTVSGVLAMISMPAQAEVTFESMLKENGGDIDRTHWAANAIQELVDKYQVMGGYPDKKFRGDNKVSRYELAASLYGVMKSMDRTIDKKMSEMKPPDMSKYATKDDLKTVAALQMEFKKELEKVKADQMDLAKKVDMMSRVQVHGGVEIRYRDRVAVTDGTDAASPLQAVGNTSASKSVAAAPAGTTPFTVSDRANAPNKDFANNGGQFARGANGLPTKFNSPAEANVTSDDLAPFRVRTNLMVMAKLTDNMKVKTSFDMWELGAVNNANGGAVGNGGHNVNEGGSQFVFRKAMLDVGGKDEKTGMGTNFKVGLMNFGESVNPGTSLTNHFGNSNWVGRSYGMVGYGGSETGASKGGDTNNNNYRNSVSRYWAGGLDASMVDPDSKNYNQATSPAVSLDTDWGWGKFMVGLNYGAVQTNRQLAAAGNLGSGAPVNGDDASFKTNNTDTGLYAGAVLQGLDRKTVNPGDATVTRRLVAGNLALPSQYGDGYGVLGLDFNFFKESFPVRIGLHAMSYLNDNMLDFSGPTRKEISGVLDLGSSKGFGATLQVNKSFIGFDRHALGIFFNNIANSGFDVQVGANLVTRGLFGVGDLATGSAGLALGIPLVNMGEGKDNLKLLIGARQSFGDGAFGKPSDTGASTALAALQGVPMFKDSGLTVSLPYMNVCGSPLNIRAEYSMLLADELWSFRPVAHDLSVVTSYWF